MLFNLAEKPDIAIYISRRKNLIQAIKDQQTQAKSVNNGKLLFIGGFERDAQEFIQESSFYYLTGIEEPGVALLVDLTGHTTLYIPRYQESRAKWIANAIEPTQQWATQLGVNTIEFLGEMCKGYMVGPFFDESLYCELINQLKKMDDTDALYTLAPQDMHSYIEQRLVVKRLQEMVPTLAQTVTDISALVADLRSSKDMQEIELLKEAATITTIAHGMTVQSIRDGTPEQEIKASVEGGIALTGARMSFPSIVASGKSGAILHYTENNKTLKNGDLVILDIGASYHHYAADLTRTYPISGTFTKRQREVYDIVLAAQEYIADLAQPGWYLSYKEKPDKSLNHLAKKFFADRGYEKYFTHGIGHYLGLDVHDVGDYSRPLREGDVITIEPGLYIPEENIFIRIEDNYWIIKNGAVCLSEGLPKTADDIEDLMKQSLSENQDDVFNDECEDEDCEGCDDDYEDADYEESEDDMPFNLHNNNSNTEH